MTPTTEQPNEPKQPKIDREAAETLARDWPQTLGIDSTRNNSEGKQTSFELVRENPVLLTIRAQPTWSMEYWCVGCGGTITFDVAQRDVDKYPANRRAKHLATSDHKVQELSWPQPTPA